MGGVRRAPAAAGRQSTGLLLSTGAYALAWTAGFLFVVAPAGCGRARRALVAALAPVLDRAGALAVAVLSRVLMTVGDLLWGAVGAALRVRGGTDVATVTPVKQLGKAADA